MGAGGLLPYLPLEVTLVQPAEKEDASSLLVPSFPLPFFLPCHAGASSGLLALDADLLGALGLPYLALDGVEAVLADHDMLLGALEVLHAYSPEEDQLSSLLP